MGTSLKMKEGMQLSCWVIALSSMAMVSAPGQEKRMSAKLVRIQEPKAGAWRRTLSSRECSATLVRSIQQASSISPLRCLPSPSGAKALFTFGQGEEMLSGYEHAALYRTDGPRVTEIAAPTFRVSYSASWSPDGMKVAMTGTLGNTDPGKFYRDQVFVYDTSSATVTEIGAVPGAAFEVTWVICLMGMRSCWRLGKRDLNA